MNDPLELIIGSTTDFDVELFDDNDAAEDLSEVTEATLVIKDALDGFDVLLLRRTTDDTLTVDVANSKLTATLTQDEADDLEAGQYVGEVALEIDGKWRHSRPFLVTIRPSAAPHE